MDTVLGIFRMLDKETPELVRLKFLAKIGMDGEEEALFFDSERVVDSITNPKYHDLRAWLNADATDFRVFQYKQNIRFEFTGAGRQPFRTDVPFTINTNGAWHRPTEKYDGLQEKNDKGHKLMLAWGERRPYKSKEIATSTNTYVDLSRAGIFS
jgi:hypothetical protein